jgi:hypothetical protein
MDASVNEALRLVRILIARGCEPSIDVDTREVVSWVIEAGMNENDCLIALTQAAVLGWIGALQFGTIRLTSEGIAASMKKRIPN